MTSANSGASTAGTADIESVTPPPQSPLPSSRACPYRAEPIQTRALKCKYCRSYVSDKARQQAVKDFLRAMGFGPVEVGTPGFFGLSIPGAIILVVSGYFGMKGLFTVLGSQPANLQLVLGVLGVVIALAYFRSSK